jgi:tRNA-specific adenosine deaminase 3
MPHLRRCSKPGDLPVHLKSQFMNESVQSRHIHTGKSNWVYILLGPEASLSRDELANALVTVEGYGDDAFIRSIPVPLLAPTSQVQAAFWSLQFWPTVYRKNNPLGPHPSQVCRASEEIADDAPVWMTLAHEVGRQTAARGFGEPIGAALIQRDGGRTRLVALAGDARWLHQKSKIGCTGNPMAHAVLRAVSMVAQKLVRAENRVQNQKKSPIMEFEAFQDAPITDAEKRVFDEEHPNPDGYLCHGLELYITHEPCAMCSMAILHSRMGKVIFSRRMPLTGGLGAEDRGHDDPDLIHCGGGHGLGLFWRRELNWSLLAWEWEPRGARDESLAIDNTVHA